MKAPTGRWRRWLSALGVIGLAVTSMTLAMTSASADSIPFTDTDSNGYLGFCDGAGHQITKGNIGAAPFVVRAVSSVAAPTGFSRSVLNVYQPRKEVDPGDWSGKQLTAASTFTNPAHPMAQGTGRDPAMVDFVSVFPPKWDGLVQLRMYFSAPDRPVYSRPYPATVIQVKGTTWTVLTKGTVDCSAGSATSVEAYALPSNIRNKPTDRSTPGSAGVSDNKTGSKPQPNASNGSGSGGTAPSANGSVGSDGSSPELSNAANASKAGDDSVTGLVLLAVAAFAVLATTGFVIFRRRRSRAV